MTQTEALKLALEALEVANSLVDGYYLPKEKAWLPEIEEAITAIKAVLEAKDEPIQEPAAWISKHNVVYPLDAWHEVHPINELKPLYTNPPQRTWVGLTDKDWNRSKHNQDFQKGVDWAEEMLKGKNT